jgi:hypothetical protein
MRIDKSSPTERPIHLTLSADTLEAEDLPLAEWRTF